MHFNHGFIYWVPSVSTPCAQTKRSELISRPLLTWTKALSKIIVLNCNSS